MLFAGSNTTTDLLVIIKEGAELSCYVVEQHTNRLTVILEIH